MKHLRLFSLSLLAAASLCLGACGTVPKADLTAPPPTVAEQIRPYCLGFDVITFGFETAVLLKPTLVDAAGLTWKASVVDFVHGLCANPPANLSWQAIVASILQRTDALHDFLAGVTAAKTT